MSTAAELVARCFAARTTAHMAHLRTKSYSAHMALQGFYEDVIDATDEYIECYQGCYGVVEGFPAVPLSQGELTPIKELREWLHENRTKAAQGQTELGNLVDVILGVCDRAIYKLVNLR